MRAYQVVNFGVEELTLADLPEPVVAPGTVLVRVHAVSLNYRDLMIVKGLYNPRLERPRIPCSDGAGEIVAVGDGVTRVKVGDRVCGIFMQHWLDGPPTTEKSKGALGGDIDGMLAEYVLLSEDGVVEIPEHLSFEEAATLPCAGLTAWNALQCAGEPLAPIKAGETILIQGTGGVSLFALQFGTLLGAKVIGTSSSDEKLAKAKALGLSDGCNYRETPKWSTWSTEVTGGRGVDRVIEVGGAGTFAQSLQAVRIGGMVAQIGVLSGGSTSDPVALTPILHKQIHVQGIYVGSRAMFEEMNAAIGAAALRPVIDQVFPFAEARAAFAWMESASHFGKIVIKVG